MNYLRLVLTTHPGRHSVRTATPPESYEGKASSDLVPTKVVQGGDPTAEPGSSADNLDWLSLLLRLIRAHPTIPGTGLVILLGLIKVAAVSGYDPTTMLAVMSAVGPVSILVGTLIAPPYPLLLAVTACLWVAPLLARTRHQFRLRIIGAAIPTMLVLLLFSTKQRWYVYLFLPLLQAVCCAFWVKGWSPKSLIRFFTLASLVLILALTFIDNLMWLPKEVVLVQGDSVPGTVTLKGYMLGNDDTQWVSFLQSGHRQVIRLASADIERRRVCKYSPAYEFWFSDLKGLTSVLPGYGAPPPRCGVAAERMSASE